MLNRLGEAWRKRMRRRLWRKQKHCRWCSVAFDEPFRMDGSDPIWAAGSLFPTIDHVVPLSENGSNKRSNLTLACEDCNDTRNN